MALNKPILVAFDKFKHCMTADEACQTVQAALLAEGYSCEEVFVCPLTDGGDGFVDVFIREQASGSLRSRSVLGPRLSSVDAKWGWVSSLNINASLRPFFPGVQAGQSLAVIGMAEASGLALLDSKEVDPWQASSRGTGELIDAAVTEGAEVILLGIGGSATNDLGLGALEALGLRARDGDGQLITSPLVPQYWEAIASFDASNLPRNLPPVFIACDVDNPLCGPKGATAVYGPQKGVQQEDVARLDREMDRLGRLLCQCFEKDMKLLSESGSGAAGGIACGLGIALGARIVSGFELTAAWIELEEKYERANVLITGEGRFDASSLEGKGPGSLLAKALVDQKASYVFAGNIESALRHRLNSVRLEAITPEGMPLEEAFKKGPLLLERSVRSCIAKGLDRIELD